MIEPPHSSTRHPAASCAPRPSFHRVVSRIIVPCILGLALVYAGPAGADSASLTVTATGGQSDPVAGLPRIFTVSGTAAVPADVYVKFRAPGGAPCAPNAKEDSGSTFDSIDPFNGFAYGYDEVNGNFQMQHVFTWPAPGPEVFCIWVAHAEGEPFNTEEKITVPFTQTIDFRAPTGTVTATVSPRTPQPGQPVTVQVTGASESPAYVYAKVRPAGGAPCAPDFEADPGESLIDQQEANGSFSLQATTTEHERGTYTICVWLAADANATPAVAGPQAETFAVGARAPCAVPAVEPGWRLSTAERRLQASHCEVGRIRYAHSTRVRRGAVIGFSPGAHASRPAGTRVEVIVSSGRPARHRVRHRR